MAEFRQDRFAASLSWMSDSPFRLAYIVRAVTPAASAIRRPASRICTAPNTAHGQMAGRSRSRPDREICPQVALRTTGTPAPKRAGVSRKSPRIMRPKNKKL
ncbi:hypothetical protein QWZ10_15290 [Paracoccus cavernae]|uniref:Uncharacterized protein n=1 Tax=Paracoccus cavernae TaxID=1571207 RepID=A0ABT8D7P8_9RHOB|nr:hypothetical protein [Paracoccus cavernae]